ncbi:mannonate dehydratase [Methylopila capsulata]|uniref:Mannonate dehydratase n=1 Tax=Methylopila capsulata TaxID=61654 RepID=A0A9W6IUI5_9HYPH|nr:mannonate dehydratase [Methylopila capsulata]MBM7852601.1 mannonate dehydratase [Methylopila capsulata]GLK56808.1 mannonate dehydratase [Methylopila capsulata]
MRESWRWFGPDDPVSLDDIRQAGAREVVTALHQVPIGEAWTVAEVEERKRIIESGPRSRLDWTVVESIPIPDDVKRTGAAATRSIAAWIASLEALAACGIRIVCYNFMPVVDWCRTDLEWELANGAKAMRFDLARFAAFELHILKRPGAERDFDTATRARANAVFDAMSEDDVAELVANIASALPGSTTEPLTIPAFRDKLAAYGRVDAAVLRRHLVEFLEAVTPRAEELGVTLTLHPDDPPRPLFGLPRIASSGEDYAALFDAVSSPANGMCFCTGSLGAGPANDLPAIARRFGPRIAFAHLRATRREADGSFFEADHLDGDVDMVAVLKALLAEDRSRAPDRKIVFRSDHGHRMLDDLGPSKRTNPGYTAIGRLRGLAELRGAIRALEAD